MRIVKVNNDDDGETDRDREEEQLPDRKRSRSETYQVDRIAGDEIGLGLRENESVKETMKPKIGRR